MRAENLTHAATAVVVRDSYGRVFVHRRTDTKDLYPGRLDFAAGGVVAVGEDPHIAAVRELAEELGVTDVPLELVRITRYTDDHTDYWGHCFTTTYDGPVRLQPEEVAEGDWWTLDRLVAALDSAPADGPGSFMPDTAGLLADWLRDRLADRVPVRSQGWDSHAEIVEGTWLDRTARRPDVAQRLEVEVRLMPRLAPRLPLAVPVPMLLDTDPPRARHPLVPGGPADPQRLAVEDGERVGAFLRTLHDTPATVWEDTGIARDADRIGELDEMADRVVPMLPADLRAAGRALLARCREASYRSDLRHGDVGPEHLLVTDGRVSGLIDWTDVAIGDRALDLAWVVNGTPASFAEALISAYGATRAELARGRDWHLLGPWWEVWYGLHDGGEEFVTSGLKGARDRLQQS